MNDLKEIAEQATMTQEDLLEILLKENTPEFNILKLCEELAELQEKLLKYVNKKPEKRPSTHDIMEEFGDVALRGAVVIDQLGIDADDIEKRVDYKIEKLINYHKEGKYKGGL